MPARTWWAGLLAVAAVYVVTRAIVLAVALGVPHPQATTAYAPAESPLLHWDAGHYLFIARHGYAGLSPTSDAVAFFPGYPLLCRLLTPFMPAVIALPLVAHIAGGLGICLLYAWACRHVGPWLAAWCAGLICCYHPAMFFSFGYADAMLFACVGTALLLLERQRWFAAAGVSALATFIRPTGLPLAAVVFLYTWWNRQDAKLPRRMLVAVSVGVIAVAGLIAYQGYLWHTFDRPDSFFAAQQSWHAKPKPDALLKTITLKPIVQPLIRPFAYVVRGDWNKLLDPIRCANPIASFIILIAAIVGLRRPGSVPRVFYLLPIMVFLMGYVLDPADGGRLLGIARYQLVALPSFLLLACWLVSKWGWQTAAVLGLASLAYQAYCVHLFACQIVVG